MNTNALDFENPNKVSMLTLIYLLFFVILSILQFGYRKIVRDGRKWICSLQGMKGS